MRENSTAQLAWIHCAWRKQAEVRPQTPPEEMLHPEPQMTAKITSKPTGLKWLCPHTGTRTAPCLSFPDWESSAAFQGTGVGVGVVAEPAPTCPSSDPHPALLRRRREQGGAHCHGTVSGHR